MYVGLHFAMEVTCATWKEVGAPWRRRPLHGGFGPRYILLAPFLSSSPSVFPSILAEEVEHLEAVESCRSAVLVRVADLSDK